MDAFLGKVTQHAMNYAIRSGIGITAGYAIKQTSRLLKTVEDDTDYQELHDLQARLDGKIRIISPSIDMIELISAKGNTTLESAVTLTKALRWDIQSLGIRLAKAAAAEEESRRNKSRAKTRAAHALEIRLIVQDIKKLLTRIEDAVPLINLAITTSGARLSTALPSTVSPSRLLQASTFLTAGDTQFSMSPTTPMQVGPSFTLTLYMLFAGYARAHDDSESIRDMAWKEVIHKARVKLMRVPLQSNYVLDRPNTPLMESIENAPNQEPLMPGEGKANEYAYHIEIIEDLDDDRVHSFEDDSPTPGPYGDVQLAGIREFLPIHQISKIFYASTGKILNIGEGETNSPVLLLKRDINALPPRRMMKGSEREDVNEWAEESEDASGNDSIAAEESDTDSQDELDRQLRRESSAQIPASDVQDIPSDNDAAWRFPPDLDPEWLALEVYTEEEDDSSTEDGDDPPDDSAYVSHRPSSSGEASGQAQGDASSETKLTAGFSHLHLDETSSPSPSPSPVKSMHEQVASPTPQLFTYSPKSPFGNIRSSLSLMEMLIRLTALQQFQQASHLAIPDELLTFFLEESSTTGAGGDGDERRRTRREARRKVGFDPYDESPIKRHGEDYQYQEGNGAYSRGGTPYDEFNRNGYVPSSPHWQRERSMTPQGTPDPWLIRSIESPSRRGISEASPSPKSPYRPQRRAARPLDRVQLEHRAVKTGSPLGRGISVETDSTLGTSPASPTLVGKREDKTV